MLPTFFHTHAPAFEGTHAHEIGGSTVEHTHVVTRRGADGPGIEVVEVFGARYKRPKTPPAANAESVTLDVHDVVTGHHVDTA